MYVERPCRSATFFQEIGVGCAEIMESLQPDFEIIERTWELLLRQRGLSPSRIKDGVATGYETLEIYRQETQVAEFDLDQPPGHGFIGSLEVRIVVKPPPPMKAFDARDLITQRGPSLNGVLESCATAFVDV